MKTHEQDEMNQSNSSIENEHVRPDMYVSSHYTYFYTFFLRMAPRLYVRGLPMGWPKTISVRSCGAWA